MPRLVQPRPVASNFFSETLLSGKALLRAAIATCALLLLAIGLVSCGSSNVTATPTPNIAGAWEFLAVSNTGSVTGIEVALKEGQIQVNGMTQYDGQISASSSQIAFVNLAPANLTATGFGGTCTPVTNAVSLGPGTVTSLGAPINFTFTENGAAFDVTGMLSGDGQSLLSGAYSPDPTNTTCMDQGTITGTVVPRLTGNYTGKICPLSSADSSCTASDNVISSTLSETSSGATTLTLVLTGTDNTTFTMTGQAMGNALSVQGTFNGQLVVFYGYYEASKGPGSLYLVNATSSAPFAVGTLTL